MSGLESEFAKDVNRPELGEADSNFLLELCFGPFRLNSPDDIRL